MKSKRAERLKRLKRLTRTLIRRGFGDLVLDICFRDPYEEEDLDVDVLLKEKPPDLSMRSYRIYEQLEEAGFEVGILYDWPEDESEREAVRNVQMSKVRR